MGREGGSVVLSRDYHKCLFGKRGIGLRARIKRIRWSVWKHHCCAFPFLVCQPIYITITGPIGSASSVVPHKPARRHERLSEDHLRDVRRRLGASGQGNFTWRNVFSTMSYR